MLAKKCDKEEEAAEEQKLHGVFSNKSSNGSAWGFFFIGDANHRFSNFKPGLGYEFECWMLKC